MRPEAQPGFAKREGLKPKVFFFSVQQLSNSNPVLSKPMQPCPQPLGNFCDVAAKISILTPFQSHRTFLSHMK